MIKTPLIINKSCFKTTHLNNKKSSNKKNNKNNIEAFADRREEVGKRKKCERYKVNHEAH